MSLRDRLVAEIVAEGPMRVDAYMARCLWDPTEGYYATRPAIGPSGDFLTAPQVSQMFGELLGLWAVQVWIDLGRPERVTLVEIGPGDGTLMDDALRAARIAPDFLSAAEIVLVEPSAPLRAVQADRLTALRHVTAIDALPADRPLIVIANEVLDCLPCRQFVRLDDGWAERCVGIGKDGDLAFALAPAPSGFAPPLDSGVGQVVEIAPAQEGFVATLAERIAGQGGAALLIDYGRAAPEPGDTLQASRGHVRQDPLAAPGDHDLTVWVDFPGVLASARAAGAATAGPVGQGDFLHRLGIGARAERLERAGDDPERLRRQMDRLIAGDQMGALFKVVCLYRPEQPTPPGFDEAP